ncbi:MAG TPA: sterol desaturase family protein [Burkholderiales bacterium]|nr:sterol desaturase family protein [Burkholderiales bacterium]
MGKFLLLMLLWLPACLLFLAFYEYVGHRWPLHELDRHTRRLEFVSDHKVHHRLYARRFQGDEVPAWYDALHVRGLIALLWSGLLMMPVYAWWSRPLAVTFVLSAVAHGIFWQWIHVQMHQPSCAWFTATRYYRFVRDFHAAHHRQARSNYGFVFPPFFDRLFGTEARNRAVDSVSSLPVRWGDRDRV